MKLCNKKCFHKQSDARRSINNIKKKGRKKMSDKGRRPIREYFCHICESWHITSEMKFKNKSSSKHYQDIEKNRFKIL